MQASLMLAAAGISPLHAAMGMAGATHMIVLAAWSGRRALTAPPRPLFCPQFSFALPAVFGVWLLGEQGLLRLSLLALPVGSDSLLGFSRPAGMLPHGSLPAGGGMTPGALAMLAGGANGTVGMPMAAGGAQAIMHGGQVGFRRAGCHRVAWVPWSLHPAQ
jgi:hypothetical protein